MIKKLFFLLCLCLLLIIPISGEILEGNITYGPIMTQEVGSGGTGANVGGNYPIHFLNVHNIEYATGIVAIISYQSDFMNFDVGAPAGAATEYQAHLTNSAGAVIFSGTLGYQRIFNALGIEQYPYIWLTVDGFDQNATTLTGNQQFYIQYSETALHHARATQYYSSPASPYPSGNGIFSFVNEAPNGRHFGQVININKNYFFQNDYVAIKPKGIGIEGTVSKLVGGLTYPSKVTVYNGATDAIITSQTGIDSLSVNFATTASSIKISTKNSLNIVTNSSRLFTPLYSYNLTPNPTNLNQKPYGVLSGELLNLKFYSISDITVGTQHPTFYNPTESYNYNFLKNSTGYWNAYTLNEGYSYNLGTAIPNNLLFTFYEGGTRTIKITAIDSLNEQYIFYATVVITGSGANEYTLYPVDYINGNFVSGATLSIKDIQNQSFIANRTVITADDCVFYLNTGWYGIYAIAPNFNPQYNGVTFISGSKSEQIVLYPLGGISGDITNSTVILKAQTEPNLYPLQGAIIKVSGESLSSDLIQTTTFAGVATFELQNSTTYKAEMTAQGYNTVTMYFTTDSNPYYKNLVTMEGNENPITYSTTIPTPTFTIVPVLTPLSWNNNTAATCNILPANASIIDVFINNLACNGLKDAKSQSIGMAAIIIFIFIIAGAKYGKGVGAGFGAITGFVLSLAMDLIPFWVFAALIVLAGLLIAGTIYSKSG